MGTRNQTIDGGFRLTKGFKIYLICIGGLIIFFTFNALIISILFKTPSSTQIKMVDYSWDIVKTLVPYLAVPSVIKYFNSNIRNE